MPTQITHEAEQSRQHARYQIPVKIILAGQKYVIDNWSISGFSIKHLPDAVTHKGSNKGKLFFDFLDFETCVNVEFEVTWYNEDKSESGCRFVNLAPSQLSLLHYVINAYLAGEVVSNGDLINVLRRDNYTKERDNKLKTLSMGKMLGQKIRKISGYLTLLAIIAMLLLFITYTLYQRMYVVESLAAVVDAPVVVIRAPQASYFHSIISDENSSVSRGKVIALTRLIGGGSNSIESPCDCSILAIHVLDKQFIDRGEPVMTLLPNDAELYVNAKISYKYVKKITINQPVEIRLANGAIKKGFVRDVKVSESIEKQHATPLASTPISPIEYVDVLIATKEPLDTKNLGAVATVKIDTFSSPFVAQ